MLYFFIFMTVFLCGKIIKPCAHYMLTLSPVLHPNSIKIGYFTFKGLDKSVFTVYAVQILQNHLFVCVCCQWDPVAAASTHMWYTEGLDSGAVLLHDTLPRLLDDVPSDQRAVYHQTLHHLQHVGGTTFWFIR